MTRGKKLIFLVVCMVVLIAAYFFISDWAEEAAFDEYDTPDYYYMTTYTADEIASMSWDYNGASYQLVKENGTWYDSADKNMQIDQEQAVSLAKVISQLTCTQTITDVEDYQQYGLDPVKSIICVTLEDGTVYEIITGDYNSVAKKYYSMIGGQPEVYLSDAYYIDNFECTTADLVFVEETEAPLS